VARRNTCARDHDPGLSFSSSSSALARIFNVPAVASAAPGFRAGREDVTPNITAAPLRRRLKVKRKH